MPVVRIEVIRGRTASEKRRLFEEVHGALVEAFGIPEEDRIHRLIEHDPESFEIPPGHSEKYTLVEVTAFPGRSPRAKRSLYQAIVRRFGSLGIPSNDILIILVEPPMQNWGIRGGHPASEVDLGYRTDV